MAKKTFQQLQQELDGYLEELQSDRLDVDQAIKLYEKATICIKEIQAYLKTAEVKINKVKKS